MAPVDGARLAVAFAAVVRRAGIDVPVSSVAAFHDALGHVGLVDRTGVYWAGRATLVRRPEHGEAYDAAFAAFWEHGPSASPTPPLPPPAAVVDDPAAADGGDGGAPPSGEIVAVRYSAVETLRSKDFAACSPAELDELHRLMGDARVGGALRRSRRRRGSRRPGDRPDLRGTVRHAMRTGGEPLHRARTRPRRRPRRVVVLVDVSGSMEPYARMLLRFVHLAVVGPAPVEAFALGTRLTRLTRELATHDPDAALAASGRAVPDWSGGTRLGEAIGEFIDRWGARGMARGAVVVVLSDGWDRGDAALLGSQMRRLRRLAHRVVWVNPLKATPGYAPLAAGMAAALPSVDAFVEGHSLASLASLAELIGRST